MPVQVRYVDTESEGSWLSVEDVWCNDGERAVDGRDDSEIPLLSISAMSTESSFPGVSVWLTRNDVVCLIEELNERLENN